MRLPCGNPKFQGFFQYIHYIYKIFFKHSDMKKIFLIFDTSTIDQQEDIVIALNGLLSMLS